MSPPLQSRFEPWRVGATAALICGALSCLDAGLDYVHGRREHAAETHERLLQLTTAVAALVDGDLHESITRPEQDGSPEYEKAVTPLRSFLRATPELRFVYTLRLLHGEPRFVLDATPHGDADHDGVEDHSAPMDAYEDAPPTAMQALSEDRPMTTPDFYRDRWGTLLSGYAPVRDGRGRQVGTLAIDMTAARYEDAVAELRRGVVTSLVVDGTLSFAIGFVVYRLLKRSRDAERRSLAAREAREGAEERHRIVAESASDAILVIDDAGIIRYANPAAGAVFGRDPADLQDRLSAAVVPELLRGAPSSAEDGAAQDDGGARPLELTVRRKDQTEIIVEVSMVETLEGDKTFLTAFFRDVSHRKLIERKTREAVNAKVEFLGIVSHELRTPLTVIKECVEILADGSAGPVCEEQTSFLDIAKRNLQRLSRLVNNVLDYQKLEARRMEIVREPTDLDALVVETCKTYSVLAAEKGVTVEPELHGALPPVPLDRDRITQVLSNFVDNAVKYTPKGRVVVRTELAGDRVKVSVIDEGPGMPQDELSQLFGVFNQLSNAKANKVQGTGLGLSICRKIIDLHSGEVGAESVPGRGATFFFLIPVQREGASHGEAGSDRGRREGRGDRRLEAVPVEGL